MAIVHLLCGVAGGKSEALQRLLHEKPSKERWLSWVEEKSHPALLQKSQERASQDFAIRILPRACVCCTGRLTFHMELVRGLRAHRPDRVFLELGAAADPRLLREVFEAPTFRESLRCGRWVVWLDAMHWKDPRYRASEVFMAQLACAEILLVDQGTSSSAEEVQETLREAKEAFPRKAYIGECLEDSALWSWLEG